MAKLKLQPREFRLRAGARTELDKQFLQIVGKLPEDINLSEFIKTSVVENYQRQNELSELDLLEEDFNDLADKLYQIKANIKIIEEKQIEVERLENIKKEVKSLIEVINTI